MDQAIGTARDTAAFARRVVLRTLTVVGGAAAGTVIAWCLSTASATADTAGATTRSADAPVLGTTISQVVAPAVAPVTDAVESATRSATRTLSDSASAKTVDELGDRVENTAGTLCEHASDGLPELAGLLCGLDELGRGDTPSAGAEAGRSATPSPAPAAEPPAAIGKVATAGVDPDRTAKRTATGRAYADGMPRRGSPAPGMPSFPDFPGTPAPLAPAAPAPAAGQHGSAGNPADPALFAASPWRHRTSALVCGLTTPATVVTIHERVGAQPGVTPD